MRLRSLLVATALGIGLLTTPAQATTVPDVLRPAATDQFPEGVAWDPSRQALLVGSFTSPPRITAAGRDGANRTVVTDPAVPGFVGLKVDARRHRIVAVYGNPNVPGVSGLGYYDLTTGARERLVTLPGGEWGANDVALDPAGNAYVTDAGAGAVYRVDPAGRVRTLVTDPRLGPAIGANGIVWHPGGYLVVGNYTTGRLFRFARGTLTELRLATPLVGADGMALRPDGTLVVVTNALAGLPGSRAAVHELVVVGAAAVPLRSRNWPDPAPTTAAVTPYGTYVLDGHLDAFLTGGSATDFVLRRL
jgi:sugar lactone lactonase YvrE